MDFVAACKNNKDHKPCTYKFCHKCLLNRYGEKAEEVEVLEDWHCPKCRGICNCSFCMKKRGHHPTGMLIHHAKVKGFSSVSQMLLVGGSENVCASPKKRTGSSKVCCFKRGKENFVDENSEESNGHCDQREKEGERDDGVKMKKSKKSRVSKGTIQDSVKREEEEKIVEMNDDAKDMPRPIAGIHKVKKNAIKTNEAEANVDIPLPQGVDLKTVAGIDIPSEDVGHALQFLEFCNAFGQVLDLKKGQPESILQELMNGCSRRRGQYSLVVQFHIQLLSLIQKDIGEESTLSPSSSGNSWLQTFGKFVAESNCALKELPADCFQKEGDGYNKLDPSQKLRLMNFLCDEALGTTDLRNWIDEEKVRFAEREKDAKGKVIAAKDKEKELKRKMQDEVAKAILERNGVPLSISEHENLVSKIKAEAAKAHAETLEAIGMVPKKKQRSDAVRTEPVLLDGNGHAFWRLNGYSSEPSILLQDIGGWDSVTPDEKWFAYDDEKKKAVEDYISSIR
ncbi:DDT domain [Macleaya cordata]|uniref:DDT domain n=1 Tax=Macleaya cordata TaxID=56857 RepID=A0A200R042_MACCD|nr:DDT domain [Macleaya cordata]